MGLFSSGSSAKRAKRQAMAAIANAEKDMKAGYEAVTEQISPYDTEAAFWQRYQQEALGTGPSQFEMSPMNQAYKEAKQREAAQILANSGMQFSGAGMEQIAGVGADVQQQLYNQYLNQIMGGVGVEQNILGMQTGATGEYYGGLAEADLQRGNLLMQYAQQKAAADRAKGGALGSVFGSGAGALIGNMVAPGLGGILGGAFLGGQMGGGLGSAW